jgi:hypothetical protein
MQRVLITRIEVQFTEYITVQYSTVIPKSSSERRVLVFVLLYNHGFHIRASQSPQGEEHQGESEKKREKKE